jgi:hypothetical protein
MTTDPIHVAGTDENNGIQAFSLRLYFPIEMPRTDIERTVQVMLGDSHYSDLLVSAYELTSDGFGRLVPGKRIA